MTERFELDPAHTKLGFSVTHLGVTAVRGWFARFSGWFEADRAQLGSAVGEVSIEAASLTTGEDQRDAHLRSADFFDVERFPAMTFRLTNISARANGNYQVAGDLTIKDVTRSVLLDARYQGETANPFGSGTRIGVSATGQLDRTSFGLNWNQMAGAVRVVALPVNLEIDAEVVAQPGESEAGGVEELLGRLSPGELEALRRALDRVSSEVDARLGKGPESGAASPEAPRRGLFGRRHRN
ncbi:MAG: YceI family protein [Candidatus Dormiibacterota bacterium]